MKEKTSFQFIPSKWDPKKLWYFIKIFLIFGIIVFFLQSENHYSYWYTGLFLIIGFLFGKITCSLHFKKFGFWITLFILSILNFIHSMIDGFALINVQEGYRELGIVIHEIIRQPVLYFFLLQLQFPFSQKFYKFFLSIIAITGVWFIGFKFGILGIKIIPSLPFFEEIVEYSIFIFIGDIVHHLYDDFKKFKKNKNYFFFCLKKK